MKNKKLLNLSLILLPITLIQFYAPTISLGNEAPLFLDIFLVYLAYISIKQKRYNVVIFGFTIGLFQDFISQQNLLGMFAFSKTIAGYMLCLLSKYSRVWRYKIKILYIYIVFQVHYFLTTYLMFDRSVTPFMHILELAFIQTIFMVLATIIINKFILIDNKILR